MIRATTDSRSSPLSSATIDDPSLTTATGMASRSLGGAPGRARTRSPPISTSSPGSNPSLLERGDHAHAPQPVLDVRERLLVLEVVARDQPLDGVAGDAELAARRSCSTSKPPRAAGRKTWNSATSLSPASSSETRARRPGRGAAARARSSSSPWPRRARGDEHGHVEARAPLRGRRLGRLRACTRSAFESARIARQLGQPRVVLGQLGLDHAVVRDRVRAVERREVEHVHEQPRALDVREEVVPEAGAVAGALDQPGDVGDHELAVVGVERAEHRLERGERVGGDLRRARASCRASSEDLPAFGSPTSPTSASSLRCSSTRPSSPGSPCSASRGAWRVGADELLVAAPAGAARGDRDLLAGAHEVVAGAVPLGRPACRAARATISGSPSAPWRWAPWPCPPRSARKCARRLEGLQVAQRVVAAQDHVAAAAAVAAVRPALGHVRLAPERQAAVAAAAGADLDPGPVSEHPG